MKSNVYNSKVMPEDLDTDGNMTVPAVYRKIVSSIGLNIVKEGYGIDVLAVNGLTWVLARFAMELERRPRLYENLEIKIGKGSEEGLRHERNVELISEEYGRIGCCVTEWCIMDKKLRKPVQVELRSELEKMAAPCRQPKRMKPFMGGLTAKGKAGYSECDFNGHLNNGRYIDRFFDLLPNKILSLIAPLRLDVNFKSEVPCGASTVSSVREVNEKEYDFCMYHDSSPACCASLSVL